MAGDTENEVPDGAAVFPLIPEELEVHPLLLAVLHATVFLAGSDDEVVHAGAATEAMDFMAQYLRRLRGVDLERVRSDLECLTTFARQEKWPRQEIEFLASLLDDFGITEEETT